MLRRHRLWPRQTLEAAPTLPEVEATNLSAARRTPEVARRAAVRARRRRERDKTMKKKASH